jgi:hypothetical protein
MTRWAWWSCRRSRSLRPLVIRRANLTDIIEAVCGVCTDTCTGLVAVDEIHNVSLATRAGAEASDMLKYFSERIPATFAYAGIDVERNGLLSGTRGEQIAGRFGMVRTSAFPRGEYWTGLTSALEDSLRLHRHQPGTLTALEEYLRRRIGGMIGSLLRRSPPVTTSTAAWSARHSPTPPGRRRANGVHSSLVYQSPADYENNHHEKFRRAV